MRSKGEDERTYIVSLVEKAAVVLHIMTKTRPRANFELGLEGFSSHLINHTRQVM